ncbi:MAG TPA: hypothetical protein VND64_16235 [Pirellulales bacterium]|nr:hypothetical protein [Pirellulales bacterium]
MSSGIHVFRFSLSALLGMVLFAAFGTAAIRFASPLWAGLTMAVTVPLLFAAILGAQFRLGQARAFWTGMAVCGWGYLLLVLAPWFETGLGQHLPTTYLLTYANEKRRVEVTEASLALSLDLPASSAATSLLSLGDRMTLSAARNANLVSASPRVNLVLRTGHALFALLFGFIGGVTAKWFYLTRSPREEERRQG